MLSQLLHSPDDLVLSLTLVSLLALAEDPKVAGHIASSDTVEVLLRMVVEYGPTLRLAAAELLLALSATRRGRAKLLHMDGCPAILACLEPPASAAAPGVATAVLQAGSA